MDNVLVYSDDQGKTWQSSPVARANGDEAKVVELSDGTLLISSRNRAGGANARTFVRSTDSGKTWSEPRTWPELTGNACSLAMPPSVVARISSSYYTHSPRARHETTCSSS